MATFQFALKHGLKIGDDLLKDVSLRELTAGDILDAREESEKAVFTADGPGLAISPTLLGVNLLRRQVLKIGNINGPMELKHIKRLCAEDFADLQSNADEFDDAVFADLASREVAKRGRDDEAPAED